MDKQLLVLLLITHVLGDFHFQRLRMARKKQASLRILILHGLVVFCLNGLIILLYGRISVFIHLAFISATHLLIDFVKGRLKEGRRMTVRHELLLFYADQTIHILVIIAVLMRLGAVNLHPWLVDVDTLYLLTKVFLGLLLLTKPANIIIQISSRRFHYADSDTKDFQPEGREGAGALIGSLERILSAILLVSGQIAAIGLIFTAKSIARFDRIQKDQRFAEYYLIGSLASMLICFLVVVLLYYVL